MSDNVNVQNDLQKGRNAKQVEVHHSKSYIFVEKNYKILIVAVLVILAIVGGSLYYRHYMEVKSQEASLQLSRILDYYNSGDIQTAYNGSNTITIRNEKLMGLRAIAEEYEGTVSGYTAAFYAGCAADKLGKNAEAKEFFEDAADSESEVVKTGALAGLAICYEKEKNFDKAAELYLESATVAIEDNVKSRYTYFAGLAYENAGKKDKAIEIYREILEKYKKSTFVSFAKASLIRLGIEIE